MKILLDENIPHGLRALFDSRLEVFTVAFLGWSGVVMAQCWLQPLAMGWMI